MTSPFTGRDILSIKEFSKQEILSLLDYAKKMKEHPPGPILKGYLLGSCFFEPSTRTRFSFEAAMKKLGGEVIGFAEATQTSAKKGESLFDSMKIMGHYVDLLVLRHPLEGAARRAAEATTKPVINAGDGSNEHPTQTLLDLYSILECQGRLEDLSIAFVGDLKYGRTAHSLAYALKNFNVRLYFVSPGSLKMPDEVCNELRSQGIPFSSHRTIEEIIDRIDILYMTRIQKERFEDLVEYESVKKFFSLKPALLERAKSELKIFHPLPRLDEIPREVDQTSHAYYFEQAENGLYVRQALLALLLGQMEEQKCL